MKKFVFLFVVLLISLVLTGFDVNVNDDRGVNLSNLVSRATVFSEFDCYWKTGGTILNKPGSTSSSLYIAGGQQCELTAENLHMVFGASFLADQLPFHNYWSGYLWPGQKKSNNYSIFGNPPLSYRWTFTSGQATCLLSFSAKSEVCPQPW